MQKPRPTLLYATYFFYLYKYFNICLQIEKEENAFCHLLHRLILNCWIHFFLLRFSKALHLANRSHLCSWAFIILSNKIWKKKSRTKIWSIKLTDSKKHWQRRRTKKNIHRLSLNCGRLMQFIRFICYCFFFSCYSNTSSNCLPDLYVICVYTSFCRMKIVFIYVYLLRFLFTFSAVYVYAFMGAPRHFLGNKISIIHLYELSHVYE